MFFEVIPTEVFRSGGGVLTYSSKEPLEAGQIVLIPLGRKTVTGVVYRKVTKVDFPTKPIIKAICPFPLPKHLLKAIFWLSQYYLTPIPTVANMLIPAGLTSKNALKGYLEATGEVLGTESHNSPIPLNPAQKAALESLYNTPSNTRLLRGITGSGKTNIYLQLAADTLKQQKSAILLVPEIALTSQLVKIFAKTFPQQTFLLHSGQTMTERRSFWLDIMTASLKNQPIVVIGPRSALLAPLHNLGLIMVDEAHEGAYYQENTPRYSALRLASFIASACKVPCIQGTATPNIVDYHLAKSKKSLIELKQKAKDAAIEAKISLIDLKNRDNFTKNRYFSTPLLTAIENNVKDKHQTLIFHNRRGSAPLTICENCGWQALCPNCYLPMTLNADSYTLDCHLCGHHQKVPIGCPDCKHPGIVHKGFGTKLLESELKKLFPNAKIARFDGDNKKDEDLASLYAEVKAGDFDILIGTQTLARGLDLPHLATVGIVQADAGLALPDFAAEERTFELLTQVIGRVGRGHLDRAEVFIQSYQPEHPVIKAATKADYEEFAKYLLKTRHEQQMPPFTYLARLSITYKTEKTTLAKIKHAHTELTKNSSLSVSPPMPAFHERTGRGFTWQIIIKASSREQLRQSLIPFAGSSQYSVVIDPPSLL